MSYALLWIETLVLVLIWVAAFAAVAARIRRRWLYWLAMAAVILLPLAPMLVFCVATGWPRFVRHTTGSNAFIPSVALTISFILGCIVLMHFAHRISAPAGAPQAAAWPRGKLFLALLLAAAVWTMTLWNIELEARAQLATMRTEAGAIMLSVLPASINDEQNAAIIYEKAFGRMDADRALQDNNGLLYQEKPDLAGPAATEFLARHAQTLALIKKATQLPECYFEHDYVHPSIAMLIPEYGKLRQAARLLQFDARYQAAHGRMEAAVDDLNAMFRLANHSGRTPFLIASLVSIAIDSMAVKTLEEFLPSLQSAALVQKVMLDDPDRISRAMRRSMLTEEAFGMATFSDIVSGRLWPDQVASGGGPEPGPLFRVPGATFLVLCVMGDDFAHYRDLLEQFRSLLAKPYFESREDMKRIEADCSQRPPGMFTAMMLPAIASAAGRASEGMARLEAARIGLAAVRYRIDKGALPEKIESLVPVYLAETPLDPFDGKPMRMKLTADRLLIYSVGPDQKDDGGAELGPKNQTADIVFSVKLR